MKQTAVEWLEKIRQGQKGQPFDDYEWEIAFNHAKEMEKEQYARIKELETFLEEEKMKILARRSISALKDIEIGEVINKVRNYYNTSCDIDGRPPSKIEFNEFLDLL